MSRKNDIVINTRTWKANIDRRLHLLMRELTLRKRPSTKRGITEQYECAIDDYLKTERIPKQVEKITRQSLKYRVSETFMEKLKAVRLIARKKKKPVSVILEELLESYLNRPENYLGKGFYERNPRKMENLK